MIIGKGCIFKIIAVAFTALMGLTILFLAFGEQFLRIEDDLSHAQTDAIVVLAGNVGGSSEDGQRIQEGAGLILRDRGQYLILPLRHNTITWSWVVEYYRINQPIPADRLLIGRSTPSDEQVITQYGGTYAEARKSVEIMRQHRMKSAVIVSSAYHMRRVKIAFEKSKKNHDLQFYYHPVNRSNTSGSFWWTDSRYAFRVLKEYRKLLAAYFIYNR
jgi:uncharacterized SAM-binding protein YcdF (DUF218 family)